MSKKNRNNNNINASHIDVNIDAKNSESIDSEVIDNVSINDLHQEQSDNEAIKLETLIATYIDKTFDAISNAFTAKTLDAQSMIAVLAAKQKKIETEALSVVTSTVQSLKNLLVKQRYVTFSEVLTSMNIDKEEQTEIKKLELFKLLNFLRLNSSHSSKFYKNDTKLAKVEAIAQDKIKINANIINALKFYISNAEKLKLALQSNFNFTFDIENKIDASSVFNVSLRNE